jgi:hypothetical protein
MLPTAPLPSTRPSNEATVTLQPVRPTTGVIDVLSEYVPGEKVIALIQAQLANGAYRATIAQRDVTLALPFSAKPGDSLNLEVVQTEGRIAFAIAKPQVAATGAQLSATTTLSTTGQLIAGLLSDASEGPGQAAVLNGNRPVLANPAAPGQGNAPVLQKAVTESGLFYESHQAGWIAGKTTEAALRGEPQAQIGRTLQGPAGAMLPGQPAASNTPASSGPGNAGPAASRFADQSPGGGPIPADSPSAAAQPGARGPLDNAPHSRNAGVSAADRGTAGQTIEADSQATGTSSPADAQRTAGGRTGLAGEIAPMVQQQLASLASNVYSFQGMIWAGQPFEWKIIDAERERARGQDDDETRPWKTRLKMLLPSLGDIDATVQLDGSEVSISMTSGTGGTVATLDAGRERLRQRMELAGLRLTALDIRPIAPPVAGGGNDDATG